METLEICLEKFLEYRKLKTFHVTDINLLLFFYFDVAICYFTVALEFHLDLEATAKTLKKLCWKLVDIRSLIPGSKFHLIHFLMAAGYVTERKDMDNVVLVDDWCQANLVYFSVVLPTYARRTMLQDQDRKSDTWAVKSYTDAAGGSNIWTYVPWG